MNIAGICGRTRATDGYETWHVVAALLRSRGLTQVIRSHRRALRQRITATATTAGTAIPDVVAMITVPSVTVAAIVDAAVVTVVVIVQHLFSMPTADVCHLSVSTWRLH